MKPSGRGEAQGYKESGRRGGAGLGSRAALKAPSTLSTSPWRGPWAVGERLRGDRAPQQGSVELACWGHRQGAGHWLKCLHSWPETASLGLPLLFPPRPQQREVLVLPRGARGDSEEEGASKGQGPLHRAPAPQCGLLSPAWAPACWRCPQLCPAARPPAGELCLLALAGLQKHPAPVCAHWGALALPLSS